METTNTPTETVEETPNPVPSEDHIITVFGREVLTSEMTVPDLASVVINPSIDREVALVALAWHQYRVVDNIRTSKAAWDALMETIPEYVAYIQAQANKVQADNLVRMARDFRMDKSFGETLRAPKGSKSGKVVSK